MTNGSNIIDYEQENYQELLRSFVRENNKDYINLLQELDKDKMEDRLSLFINENRDKWNSFVELEHSTVRD